MDLFAFGVGLMWTGEQFHDLVLGDRGFTTGSVNYSREGVAAGIEKLRGCADFAKRIDRCPPGFVEIRFRNLFLTSQDLPKPDDGLVRSHRISA